MKTIKNLIIACLSVVLTFSIMPLQASSNSGNADITLRIIRNSMIGHNAGASDNPNVRQESKDRFQADFENAKDVSWSRVANLDEVSFTSNGKHMIAYYNNLSKLVGTTVEKSFTDVPQEGRKKIKSEYSDYKIGNVILFHNKNRTGYSQTKIYGSRYEYLNNYFVELHKGNDKIVVQVNPAGTVYFFTSLNNTSVG